MTANEGRYIRQSKASTSLCLWCVLSFPFLVLFPRPSIASLRRHPHIPRLSIAFPLSLSAVALPLSLRSSSVYKPFTFLSCYIYSLSFYPLSSTPSLVYLAFPLSLFPLPCLCSSAPLPFTNPSPSFTVSCIRLPSIPLLSHLPPLAFLLRTSFPPSFLVSCILLPCVLFPCTLHFLCLSSLFFVSLPLSCLLCTPLAFLLRSSFSPFFLVSYIRLSSSPFPSPSSASSLCLSLQSLSRPL